MTAFTPGPWSDISTADGVAINHGGLTVAMVHRPNKRGYFERNGGGHVVASEYVANAHLIASAPDLFAACEAALAAILDVSPNSRVPSLHGVDGPVRALRAALAKAGGK